MLQRIAKTIARLLVPLIIIELEKAIDKDLNGDGKIG